MPHQERRGTAFGALAYLWWGTFPLYFHVLARSGAVEIVVHRVLWSLAVCLGVVVLTGSGRRVLVAARQPRLLLQLGLASAVLALNWGLYVYAVHSGHVVEGALGYFINPLVTVLLGVLVLRERLRRTQWAAVAVGAVAVLVLTLDYGRPPFLALSLALTFGAYGLLKNRVGGSVAALTGLTLETLLLGLPALALLAWFGWSGRSTFGADPPWQGLLLASTGVATVVPLLLFAASARRVPLSVVGLLQYLTPGLQFLAGVLVFHERMPSSRWAGFALVWVALVVLAVDGVRSMRRGSDSPDPEPAPVPATDPDLEQHFLVAAEPLARLVDAAGIRPGDRVVEAGAGAGTVAARLPDCAELVLVELDPRLAGRLRRLLPRARVIEGDALTVLPTLGCDVVLANLPAAVTRELLPLLDGVRFRTAVLAVDPDTDLDVLRARYRVQVVTELVGEDFQPPQAGRSLLVRLAREGQPARSG